MSLVHRSPWQIFVSVLTAVGLREMATRFGGNRLGYAWAILEPVLHIVLLCVIFAARSRIGPFGLDFPVFYMTGVVPFTSFSMGFMQGMNAVDANRGLFVYKQVKPFDVIIARWILNMALHATTFVTLMLLGAWMGMQMLPHDPLALMAAWALLSIFTLGCMFVVVILNDVGSEIRKFLPFVTKPLYFLSGVIFPVAALSPEIQGFMLLNPLTHYLELLRSGFFPVYPHIGASWTFAGLSAIISLAFGLLVFVRYRTRLVTS